MKLMNLVSRHGVPKSSSPKDETKRQRKHYVWITGKLLPKINDLVAKFAKYFSTGAYHEVKLKQSEKKSTPLSKPVVEFISLLDFHSG